MAEQAASVETKPGKCLQHNEERAVGALGVEDSKSTMRTQGDKGIFTIDQRCKMETLTTSKATYFPLKGPGVRLKGIRRELLEKQITQKIREKIHTELSPAAPEPDYSSTTQRDFSVPGFVPSRPKSTQVHDYRSEQAITFWSENCQQIQGVTPIRNLNAPFRKSALFSTPITQRLDEEELPPDD
ncbi:sperm associated antigen 8 [Fundulus heteroclitus]|uniref:sperm associated antigen 8 n=1 Tax=Fundulus heteroclitus TaxID=8078 RepID=UPI00165C20E5|nr:sperm associated antigen 8 [Fundulus heteroclitus]